jgi:hypothetical protein
MTNEQIKILLSVMSPKDFPAVRLGSNLGSYETAVANPFTVDTVGWIDTENVATGDTTSTFIFRDPFRFCVTTRFFGAGGNANSYVYQVTCDATVVYTTNFVPLTTGRFGWFSGAQPHGQYLYPGKLKGGERTYVWCNAGDTLLIANSSGQSCNLTPFYYRTDGRLDTAAFFTCPTGASTAHAPAAQYTLGVGCYVGFDIASTVAAGVSFNGLYIQVSNLSNAVKCYAHKALPWIDNNIISVDAIKIYAASLMLTNTASPLNRQGKLAAVQLPEGRDWRQYLTYDSISSVKEAYVNNAVNGYYGFLKPTQPSDLDFRDQRHLRSDGTLSQAWFLLDSGSDFIAVSAKVTDSNGRDAYVTCSASLEYRTNDQWREVKCPSIPYNIVFDAFNMISSAPQHHENPFHIGDIFDWIGDQFSGLWNGVKEAYPKVMSGLTTALHVGALAAPLLAL